MSGRAQQNKTAVKELWNVSHSCQKCWMNEWRDESPGLLVWSSSFSQGLDQQRRPGLRPGITAGPLVETCSASTTVWSYTASGRNWKNIQIFHIYIILIRLPVLMSTELCCRHGRAWIGLYIPDPATGYVWSDGTAVRSSGWYCDPLSLVFNSLIIYFSIYLISLMAFAGELPALAVRRAKQPQQRRILYWIQIV